MKSPIRILILIATFLTLEALPAHANSGLPASVCKLQAGHVSTHPTPSCLQNLRSKTLEAARFWDGQDLMVFASDLALLTTESGNGAKARGATRVLSGPTTALKDTTAIVVWRSGEAVFVLDRVSKAIRLYSILSTGNLPPSLELRNAAFEFATALAFDPATKTLFVLFGDERKVATFKIPSQRGDVEAERLVDLEAQGIAAMNQIAFAGGDLFVLDRGASKFARFPLAKLLSAPPTQAKQPPLVAKEVLSLPEEAANAKTLTLEGIATQVYAFIPGKLLPLLSATRKAE